MVPGTSGPDTGTSDSAASGTDLSTAAVALAVLGVVLVAFAGYTFVVGTQDRYVHEVERIDADAVPEGAAIHDYAALSTDATTVLRRALASEGPATVETPQRRPPESTHVVVHDSGITHFYVQRSGAHYDVTTRVFGRGFDGLLYAGIAATWTVAGFAAISAAVWWRRSPRGARSALAGAVAALLAVAATVPLGVRFSAYLSWRFVALIAAIAVVVTGAVRWLGGRRWRG